MKVSIITIAYNNLEGLKRTYESIRRQTFRDYEWLVIDGGSTDGTKRFLEEHDSELAFWCSEPDKGVYNAQNKGTRHAKGEYCIYMNSGDSFYADDVLEKVFAKDIDADVIYGSWELVFEDGKKVEGNVPEVADLAYFFDDNMCHQAMLIKRDVILARPYDESFPIYADWEEWLALYMQGKTFRRVDILICDFMVGGLSTGDNASEALKKKRQADIKRINERYYSEPWKKTMSHVAPILREYKIMKNWSADDGQTTLTDAFYGYRFLQEKRKKHNRIIRILIYVCGALLATNICTLCILLFR